VKEVVRPLPERFWKFFGPFPTGLEILTYRANVEFMVIKDCKFAKKRDGRFRAQYKCTKENCLLNEARFLLLTIASAKLVVDQASYVSRFYYSISRTEDILPYL
jgi:hypothetical protein